MSAQRSSSVSFSSRRFLVRSLVGVICTTSVLLSSAALPAQAIFEDAFDNGDGPPTGWTVFQGVWSVLDERLQNDGATGTNAEAPWIWAGDTPILMSGEIEATIELELGPVPHPDAVVGSHGGILFYGSEPTERYQTPISGYTLDWINRAEDHGFRLIRLDPGAKPAGHTIIATGGAEIVDPPLTWTVQIDGEMILVFADDDPIPVIEVADSTYREGHFAFWTFQNGTQAMVDHVRVEYEPVVIRPCVTASVTSGASPLTVDFDASCTTSTTAVAAYRWDFGDGETGTGETVSHEFLFADTYVVTLTVEDTSGSTSDTSLTINVFEITDDYFDDFSRDDGPATEWTTYQGSWSLLDEQLVNVGEFATPPWIWAGEPPFRFNGDVEIRVEVEFGGDPALPVGRHGGIMFFASEPTERYQPGCSGYTLDWIDRVEDHGFRLIRVDGGAHTVLVSGTPELGEPPATWRIQTEGAMIRVFADDDDVPVIEVADGTHRDGLFGAWTYQNGTQIMLEEVEISTTPIEVIACMSVPTVAVTAGLGVNFDGACSTATTEITAYSWDFGDGGTAEGAQASHVYDNAGAYTVTLTVATAGGHTSEATKVITAYDEVFFFSDDFDRADGDLGDWTIVQGDWQVLSERLHVDTPAVPESWIWAGFDPIGFGGVYTIQFDMEFLVQPGDPGDPANVGRHAGVFFFAQNTLPRFDGNSGYSIDWIDREVDRGYRMSYWENGAETPLFDPTMDLEPGNHWQIEIDDEAIRFLVDGEQKAEVFDTTYRGGHIGFWTYTNGQQIDYDNFQVNDSEVPPLVIRRGDVDDSGGANITDAVATLNHLFGGTDQPVCFEAADINADGTVNITDPIALLNFLFGGGEPPAGGTECQELFGETLECVYTSCP